MATNSAFDANGNQIKTLTTDKVIDPLFDVKPTAAPATTTTTATPTTPVATKTPTYDKTLSIGEQQNQLLRQGYTDQQVRDIMGGGQTTATAPTTTTRTSQFDTDFTNPAIEATKAVSEASKAEQLATVENTNNLLQNTLNDAKRSVARLTGNIQAMGTQAKKEQTDLLAQEQGKLDFQQAQTANKFQDTMGSLKSSSEKGQKVTEMSSALAGATYEGSKRQVQGIVDSYEGNVSQLTRDYILSDAYMAQQKKDLTTNALNNIVKIDLDTMDKVQQAQDTFQKTYDDVTEGKRANEATKALIARTAGAELQKNIIGILQDSEKIKRDIYESDRGYAMEEKKFEYGKEQDNFNNYLKELGMTLDIKKFDYQKDQDTITNTFREQQANIDNEYRDNLMNYNMSRDQVEDKKWSATYQLNKEDNVRQQMIAEKQLQNIDNEIEARKANLEQNTNETEIAQLNKEIKELDLAKSKVQYNKELLGQDAGTLKNTFDNETSLRKEYNGDNTVKVYNELSRQVGIAQSAMNEFLQNPNVAGPAAQAIITSFNKILDPTSVVREGEYDRSIEGQSAFDYMRGMIQKFNQGGAGLTIENLNEMSNLMNKFVDKYEPSYATKVEEYTKLAISAGLNPEHVIGSMDQLTGDMNSFLDQNYGEVNFTKDEAISYLNK